MEKRKQQLYVWAPVLACLVGFLIVSGFWMKQYRQSVFAHLSAFCQLLAEEVPESETQILSAVKNYHSLSEGEISGNTFLEQYGYESRGLWEKQGWDFLAVSMLVFLGLAGCFFAFAAYESRRSRKRIGELTEYLEKVNLGEGGLMLHAEEDEFSHLQDELYKTVMELYQTKEEAVKARINFGENLANIAHQLKTPVTAALLSLQLLENEVSDRYTAQIKKQLKRLAGLEESLLTLSKIDAGTIPMERTLVDVYTALILAAENLSELLCQRKVSVAVPEKGSLWVEGDLEWTMEALMNVMKNCMEHSPRNGTIHCDYSGNPLYAEILIWDEGEGFALEDLPYVFRRFYRGKRNAGEGMGIGLSLAKSVLELENGSITARNLPEGGACFEIRVYHYGTAAF